MDLPFGDVHRNGSGCMASVWLRASSLALSLWVLHLVLDYPKGIPPFLLCWAPTMLRSSLRLPKVAHGWHIKEGSKQIRKVLCCSQAGSLHYREARTPCHRSRIPAVQGGCTACAGAPHSWSVLSLKERPLPEPQPYQSHRVYTGRWPPRQRLERWSHKTRKTKGWQPPEAGKDPQRAHGEHSPANTFNSDVRNLTE